MKIWCWAEFLAAWVQFCFNLVRLCSIVKMPIFAGSCLQRLSQCWLKLVKMIVVGELAQQRMIACHGAVGRGEVTTGLATFLLKHATRLWKRSAIFLLVMQLCVVLFYDLKVHFMLVYFPMMQIFVGYFRWTICSVFLEMSKVILWNIISLGITVKNNKLLNKLICIQTNLYVRNIEFLSRKKRNEKWFYVLMWRDQNVCLWQYMNCGLM